MKKIIFLVIAFFIQFNPTISFGNESFDDFVKGQNKEFNQYVKELEGEFEQYKKIIDQEYKKFKKEIADYWTEPEISGPKKWVEYSKDKKTKKTVDFENGKITIDIIVDKKQKADIKSFMNVLSDMLSEDKQTAFKRDTLAQNIETRLVKTTRHIKTDKVEKKSILGGSFLGFPDTGLEQVETTSHELLKKSKIKTGPSKIENSKVLSVNVKLPAKHIIKRAKSYKPLVKEFAGKYKLDFAVVLAVMHTESTFNPMAKSYVPAYGLMQIVPRSAGREATKKIFGKSVLLSPSYLYNDKNNINVGTTYLSQLLYKYFKKVKDKQSRLFCAIAAYNTGQGNVAKAFIGKRNLGKAIKVINTMSADKVYNTLINHLPHDETKEYLKRVSNRIKIYRSI